MFASVLSDDAQNALAILGRSGAVNDGYLAGGSALALHFGHRKSEDLDFFSHKPFNPKTLSHELQSIGNFVESTAEGISVIGVFGGVKFSYFQYPYALITETTLFKGVAIAHEKDIAAMKIAAVMDRGTKRDFVDLYVLSGKGISLDRALELYDKKFGTLENNLYSIIRSLQYFDDAENGGMPQMLTSLSWDTVKEFFIAESMRLAKKYLEQAKKN